VSKIDIFNIEKWFGDTLILDKINFTIYPKHINVIIGPSGCGKSTLLNIISGLDNNFTGYTKALSSLKISYVFQEDHLLEWKSIEKNILYALSGKLKKEEFIDYGNILGLSTYWGHYPSQLSGGLRQRVNLLRAFLYPASLLLMDEPFKSLDIQTKEKTINLFLKIQKEKELTVLLVTHNLDEAFQLGEYIHIFSNKPTGKINTIINPYFYSNKVNSGKEKELFLNQVKEIMKHNMV